VNTQTTALRNRVYRDLRTDRYVWQDDLPLAAYASIPMVDRHPEGEPASGRQTAAIIGTICCFCLLLVGLAYLVWAGRNGNYVWQ
jgi:hypothetical protein